jgi:hypothetical protein
LEFWRRRAWISGASQAIDLAAFGFSGFLVAGVKAGRATIA